MAEAHSLCVCNSTHFIIKVAVVLASGNAFPLPAFTGNLDHKPQQSGQAWPTLEPTLFDRVDCICVGENSFCQLFTSSGNSDRYDRVNDLLLSGNSDFMHLCGSQGH